MFAAACSLAVVLGTAGCSDDAPTGVTPEITERRVSANAEKSATIYVGDTVIVSTRMPGTKVWKARNTTLLRQTARSAFQGIAPGQSYVVAEGVQKNRNLGMRDSVLVTVKSRTTSTPPPPSDGAEAPSTGGTEEVRGALYVAPSGSDGNPGTKSQPWRSIGQALTRLRAGQTLYVRGGTYNENIKNPTIQPGRSDARITVAAYPGERPVIVGLLWLTRPSYWTIDGINVTWSTANPASSHMVKVTDGVGWTYQNSELWGARSYANLLVYGSRTGEPSNWTLRGNCIHDTHPSNSTNQDHNMYVNTGTTAGPGLVERNVFYNAPNGQNVKLGYGRSNPQPGDGTANVTVRYNTMYSSLKPMMVTDQSHHNRIERNIMVRAKEGYAMRAYRLTGSSNVMKDNVFFEMNRLQYADAGSVTDGGGNRMPLDPKFNGAGCGLFKPSASEALSYGHLAR